MPNPLPNPYAWIDTSLQGIHRAGWYRSVQSISSHPGAVVTLWDRELLNFASNDYLGLAGDERLGAAAMAAIRCYGTGATGSRLLSGHRPIHGELEGAIARWKGTEDALVFSSGYLANLGTIAALVGPRDLILADRYNHASLHQGARLSGAKVQTFRHNDLQDLQHHLETLRPQHRRCLILADGVFSMDGDLCPLPGLMDLAEEFSCMALIDEAHATGVLGATGAGCGEHWGRRGRSPHQMPIQMGTLSKALGSLGGYVAGSAPLIDFLRNRASTWIYTTGLSPGDGAAALAAIALVQSEPQRRQQLWRNVTYLQEQLPQLQPSTWHLLPSASPIFCLQVKDPETVLALGHHLQQAGIFAAAVRPPTVPTSRIRITVMATHTETQCDRLLQALAEWNP